VDRQGGNRPSATTLLRVVATLSLVLAGAEFLLALHYRRESDRNVTEKFQQVTREKFLLTHYPKGWLKRVK
jgi:hypothetical protein